MAFLRFGGSTPLLIWFRVAQFGRQIENARRGEKMAIAELRAGALGIIEALESPSTKRLVRLGNSMCEYVKGIGVGRTHVEITRRLNYLKFYDA